MTSVGQAVSTLESTLGFCEGIEKLGRLRSDFESCRRWPVIAGGQTAIRSTEDPSAVFQTLLAADALRYLTLHITAARSSGHPGGFASAAEVIAASYMLGHKNIFTDVGHHAPGFYSALFLDRSLEDLGIYTVGELAKRFRARHGLLGHLSGAVPGVLSPAGPLGQGQHFAMAAALLHRDRLFPVTIGDGGIGEPYVMSSMAHFHTAFPEATNFLPILVWNGYSQEHHSMVSNKTNRQMKEYWRSHGFEKVLLVDAREFDSSAGQSSSEDPARGDFADSTTFSARGRMDFTRAVLRAVDEAARSALTGTLCALIVDSNTTSGLRSGPSCRLPLYWNRLSASSDTTPTYSARASRR